MAVQALTLITQNTKTSHSVLVSVKMYTVNADSDFMNKKMTQCVTQVVQVQQDGRSQREAQGLFPVTNRKQEFLSARS